MHYTDQIKWRNNIHQVFRSKAGKCTSGTRRKCFKQQKRVPKFQRSRNCIHYINFKFKILRLADQKKIFAKVRSQVKFGN